MPRMSPLQRTARRLPRGARGRRGAAHAGSSCTNGAVPPRAAQGCTPIRRSTGDHLLRCPGGRAAHAAASRAGWTVGGGADGRPVRPVRSTRSSCSSRRRSEWRGPRWGAGPQRRRGCRRRAACDEDGHRATRRCADGVGRRDAWSRWRRRWGCSTRWSGRVMLDGGTLQGAAAGHAGVAVEARAAGIRAGRRPQRAPPESWVRVALRPRRAADAGAAVRGVEDGAVPGAGRPGLARAPADRRVRRRAPLRRAADPSDDDRADARLVAAGWRVIRLSRGRPAGHGRRRQPDRRERSATAAPARLDFGADVPRTDRFAAEKQVTHGGRTRDGCGLRRAARGLT